MFRKESFGCLELDTFQWLKLPFYRKTLTVKLIFDIREVETCPI